MLDDYDIGFVPKVLEVVLEIDLSNNGSKKKKYKLTVETLTKEQKDSVYVDSLHNVEWFKLFNCPDALLSSQQRKTLEYFMQSEAAKADVKEILLCAQGLQFYNGNIPIFVFGNRIITPYNELTERCYIKQEYALKGNKDLRNKLEYRQNAKKYIQLVPEVTPILFYASLLGILKPIFAALNENVDFIIAVIGSKGHLKTSLVRLYALWLTEDIQKIDFISSCKMQDIEHRISMLAGQNLLLDDLHDIKSTYKKNRMKDRLDTVTRITSNNISLTNIFVTGESIKDMTITSTRDRMLEISMPKMDGDRLNELKATKDKLSDDFMAELAMSFATVLIEKYDEVSSDIKSFLSDYKPLEYLDGSTRISSHIKYIQITEFLYTKYFCDGDIKLSYKETLDEVLEKQAKMQEKELLEQAAEIEEDYVIVFNNIINSENPDIKIATPQDYDYSNQDSILVHKGKIYITGTVLQSIFMRYYKRIIPKKVITDAFHNAGILEEDTNTRTKKMSGIRHYVISNSMLKLYIEMKKS